VNYTSNPEITINVRQQGRISRLKESKLTNAKLYPNPAGDFLYLNHGSADLEKIVITIADLQGHVIMVRNFERLTAGEITEINLSRLPVGQFLFNISDGSESRTFQFIKY
jgi:ribosome biogenesis protein Nip4